MVTIEPRKRVGFRFVFYLPLVSAEGFFLFVRLYAFLSSIGDGFMPRKTLDMSFGGSRGGGGRLLAKANKQPLGARRLASLPYTHTPERLVSKFITLIYRKCFCYFFVTKGYQFGYLYFDICCAII